MFEDLARDDISVGRAGVPRVVATFTSVDGAQVPSNQAPMGDGARSISLMMTLLLPAVRAAVARCLTASLLGLISGCLPW
jgi:hypothetical protein